MHLYQTCLKTGKVAKLFIFFAITLLFIASFSTLDAQSTLATAPLNPAFTNYINSQSPILTSGNGYYLGYVPAPVNLSHLNSRQIYRGTYTLLSLPVSYDLRSLGKVTPVKDQGSCGSCWAFATCASLESNLLTAESRDFSENNLKNLHGFDRGHCDGGNYSMATAYLTRWNGPVNESDDPYNPDNGYSPTGLTVQKHVQEVQFIPNRSGPADNDMIKQALMSYGAVGTSMYWNAFYYNATNHSYHFNGSADSNHAVTIVGWNDNFDRNLFSPVPAGNGAFIVKNSWGTAWGDNGYFYISYYDVNIGKDNALFLNAESTVNYQRVYQYDPLGWCNGIGYYSTSAWMSNIFTAADNDKLTAIGLYTPALNSTYQVSIYLGATAGPISGTLAGTQSGTVNTAGYHTILLNTPVQLTTNQKFSIVVQITTPGYNFPITFEAPYTGYSSAATANAGESYISSNGTSWTDMTSAVTNANVCIKAYANYAAAASWEFINGSLNDTSGNGNNGTAYGTPGIVSGMHNQALSFNGPNYIQVPNSSTLNYGAGNFSIACWFNTTNTDMQNVILDKRDSSGVGYHALLYTGRPMLQIADSSGYTNYYGGGNSPTFNDGKWHFAVFIAERNSTNGVKIYVDGQLIYTGDTTGRSGSITNQAVLYIGRHKDSANTFSGILDEISLYNRVLNSDEITVMNIKGWRVGYWEFINGNTNDTCGNINNGTTYGNPTVVNGAHNQALSFNGTNYVRIPTSDTVNFGTGNFSVACWFNTSSTKSINTIIEKRNSSYVGYCLCLLQGHILLQIGDSAGYVSFWGGYGSPAYNDGQWHYVTITVERNNVSGVKIYVDGQLQTTCNPTGHLGSITSQTDLYLGYHRDSSSNYFAGTLDEVGLFGRVLTAAEVSRLFSGSF